MRGPGFYLGWSANPCGSALRRRLHRTIGSPSCELVRPLHRKYDTRVRRAWAFARAARLIEDRQSRLTVPYTLLGRLPALLELRGNEPVVWFTGGAAVTRPGKHRSVPVATPTQQCTAARFAALWFFAWRAEALGQSPYPLAWPRTPDSWVDPASGCDARTGKPADCSVPSNTRPFNSRNGRRSI